MGSCVPVVFSGFHVYLCSLGFVCTCVLWVSCVLVFSGVRVYLIVFSGVLFPNGSHSPVPVLFPNGAHCCLGVS